MEVQANASHAYEILYVLRVIGWYINVSFLET